MTRLHLAHANGTDTRPLCNQLGGVYTVFHFTSNPNNVTCKRCVARAAAIVKVKPEVLRQAASKKADE